MLTTCYDLLGKLLTPIAALATRVAVGLGFFHAGYSKTQRLDDIGTWFTSLGLPAPVVMAWVVSYLELLGGLALIVGVLTRPIAGLLLGIMVTALATADRLGLAGALGWAKREGPDGVTLLGDWSFSGLLHPATGLLDLPALVFGLCLLWLLARGPGVLSIDGLIRLAWGRDEPAPAKPAKPAKG